MAGYLFMPTSGAPAEPPTVSLVGTARRADDESNLDWINGFAWRPERCIASTGYTPCGDAPLDEYNAGAVSGDAAVYYAPPAFRVTDECPASSGAGRELGARLRRQVDAATSFRVARELWTGLLTQADPFVAPAGDQTMNPFLAAAGAVVVAGVHSPANGIARLEEAARTKAHGQQVWLHVTTAVANLAQSGGIFRRVGNIMYTPTDAVVCTDAGYPGTAPGGAAPAADHAWAYATGPITVRLSPVLVPDTNEPAAEVFDHRRNRWVVTGERRFAATFDPCVLYAVQLALPAAVA